MTYDMHSDSIFIDRCNILMSMERESGIHSKNLDWASSEWGTPVTASDPAMVTFLDFIQITMIYMQIILAVVLIFLYEVVHANIPRIKRILLRALE